MAIGNRCPFSWEEKPLYHEKKIQKMKKNEKIQISFAKTVCQYLAKGSSSAYRMFQSWLQFSENDK